MIYVIYGQGGKGPLSAGFITFKNRLVGLGYPVRDDILWRHPDSIIRAIHDQPKGEKTVLIGFSLGANCCTWVASAAQPIDLVVMYDPSVGVPGLMPSYVNEIKSNVKRAIHFHQGWSLLGRAVIKGHNVERHNTSVPHMLVQAHEPFHRITLQTLREVYQ